MKINIVNNSLNENPKYQTDESAGMDLRSKLETESIVLMPLERKLISTGLFIELPKGYEAQLRPRSGLAYTHGITVLNSPATIDSDYRGEIKVLLINLSNAGLMIFNGDRIAQMVIAKHERAELVETVFLSDSKRSEGGFGSTGTK